MKRIFFCLITLVILASCSEEKSEKKNVEHDDLYFFNDFENVKGWGDALTITKGLAHSGKYFSKTDSINQFSYGFKSIKNSISEKDLKKVTVNVWILAKDPNTKAVLVTQILRNDSNFNWQKSSIKNFIVQPSTWVNMKASFNLPKDIKPKDKILIYVWNSNEKAEVDVDDFEVQFYK